MLSCLSDDPLEFKEAPDLEKLSISVLKLSYLKLELELP